MMKSSLSLWLILLASVPLTACQNRPADSTLKNDTGENSWRVIGPGGGGGVLKPTISPFDENIVMTHCDMTAAYLSMDGGINWDMKNLWTVPEDFEFDPVDRATIYVATRGYRHSEDRGSGLSVLYKSVNSGESWRMVYPDLEGAREIDHLQNKDLLPSEIIEGTLDGTIDKVSVDPIDNQHIYLGLAPLKFYIGSNQNTVDSAMLVHSTNGGQDWDLLAKIPGSHVKAIFPCSPYGSQNEVLIFTDIACASVNEHTGDVTNLPLPAESLIAVEGGQNGEGALLYIQSSFPDKTQKSKGGMYISNDLGRNWTSANKGLLKEVPKNMVPSFRRGLAVCESQADVAYISTINPKRNAQGDVEMIYCIFKTINGGEQWNPVLLSSTPGGYITENFEGSWMEEKFDPGWGGSPIDLGVAPQNPDVCYAGDNGRGYRTTDGGLTWKQVYSHNQADGSFASGGLDVTTCYGVHPDPFDKEHYFICYTDIGLFHSFNGGESWFQSITGIPRPWQNTCYDLTFDPQIKGKVWSVWANAHDLPRTKMFGSRGFDHFKGGVAVSEDGGLNWRVSNKGLPKNSVCTNILLDTGSPEDSRTLYAAVFDRGLYKSTNGGESWKKAIKGLGDNLFAWQIQQNSEGRLFLLCSRGSRKGDVVDGLIYFSDDHAGTWNKLQMPEGINGPHDLQIDPDHPGTMYVCCWPRKDSGSDAYGGVIKTTDGGKSWKQVFDEQIRVNSAGLDPDHPETIFINTFQNSAYRSDDAGESWNRLEGYRFKWGQKAIPDVNNPGMLFLSTYGGSVYYGPAKGMPGENEDIENMPKGWW
jgi:photosystem II stability/assembly factor-like uncharacterized protein